MRSTKSSRKNFGLEVKKLNQGFKKFNQSVIFSAAAVLIIKTDEKRRELHLIDCISFRPTVSDFCNLQHFTLFFFNKQVEANTGNI